MNKKNNLIKKIQKIIIALFVIFTVTGQGPLVQKAFADDAPSYVFKVENPSIQSAYFNIFNAIKVLFGGAENNDNSTYKTYTGLLKLVFVLSSFFVFANGVIKIFSGGDTAAKSALGDYIRYLLIGFTLLFVLYSWKDSVQITTDNPDTFCDSQQSAEGSHTDDVIDNFPGLLAFTFTFINKVGLETSQIVQTVYGSTTEFQTSKNYGYMGALKSNMKVLQIDINDIHYDQNDTDSDAVHADLGNRYGALISKCIFVPFTSCEAGTNRAVQIKRSKDIYDTLANLYENNPEICNGVKARDYKLQYGGETIKCGDFWDNIKKITDDWKNELSCNIPNVTKGGISLFTKDLSQPQTSDLQSIALQVGLVGQMQKTYAQLGLGVNGIGYAAGKTRTEFLQTSLASGAYMSQMLPLLQMVIRALLYAFFPFVFIVVLLPGGLDVLKQYFQTILWVELWTPTAGILNMFMLDYAQGRLQQQYKSDGINFDNLTYYLSNDSIIAGIAGYLYISVPALTWLILKGSGYMLGNIAGAIGAGMSKNIQTQSINQDAAELKKYEEFAKNTPDYVSMAEMSHYEAIQKGDIAGGALAGTKSISLDTQGEGSFKSSYVETAKNAGQSIQAFNSIAGHTNASVSDTALMAGTLDGATAGANMGVKASNMTVGEAEVMGMDSAYNETNTAIGKMTSGAYHSDGSHARIGNAKGDLTEFNKLTSGYREQSDVGMNNIMAEGLKRQKLIKKGGMELLNQSHVAHQVASAIASEASAEGDIKALNDMRKNGEIKTSHSKGGVINDFSLSSKFRDRLIKGFAAHALDDSFGVAAIGKSVNAMDGGNVARHLEKGISYGAWNDMKNQAAGKAAEGWEDKGEVPADFVKKKLEEALKSKNANSSKKINLNMFDKNASKKTYNDPNSSPLINLNGANNIMHVGDGENEGTVGRNSTNLSTEELKELGANQFNKPTHSSPKTNSHHNPTSSSTSQTKSVKTAAAENAGNFSNAQAVSLAAALNAEGSASIGNDIGKGVGAMHNLEKDKDMYIKNGMANEMASQQAMAAKVAAQGGANGYTQTQAMASRLAADAQQGETFGKVKQDLQANGMSSDNAKKMADQIKKGLAEGGAEAAKKIADALKNVDGLEKNKADFGAQKATAAQNSEYHDATNMFGNQVFSNGMLTGLGQEAYSAQGSIELAKSTAAFTDAAKQKQSKMIDSLEQKYENIYKQNHAVSDPLGVGAESYAESRLMSDGLISSNGTYNLGKGFMVAEATSSQMKASFIDGTTGATMNLGLGSDSISGGINEGLNYNFNDSYSYNSGAHVNYDFETTAGTHIVGVTGVKIGKSVGQVASTVADVVPEGRIFKGYQRVKNYAQERMNRNN